MAGEVTHWVLLIYTVPPEPSRMRAAVWRDLKRHGAVYLRDGVCALPDLPGRPKARLGLEEIAAKVTGFGGMATLVTGGKVPGPRAASLAAELRAARDAEYADLALEAARFLGLLRRDRDHRELDARSLDALAGDLVKLRAWAAQITARDFLGSPGADEAMRAVERCAAEVALLALKTKRAAAAKATPHAVSRVARVAPR